MRLHALLVGLLWLPLCAQAQETTEVNASWLNVDLELDWNERTSFELSQSTRFVDFLDAFASSNTTFKVGYELKDWIKIVGGYRYVERERKNRKFNRYQLALQANHSINKVKLTWRTRFEYRKAINRDRETRRLRNRFATSYKIKQIDLEPKIFLEYWYTFDEDIRDFSKYRIGILLTKGIVRRMDARLGYYYETDLNQEEIEREHILILGISYKFKRQKATK